MKLSACMIAKNEEKVIATCINSYKDIVKEIIVVDTGSTDKTIEIAGSLGAKVYHYTWNNNFAEAKNFALDQAKGDWIIFLDADEYFANDTAKNIVPIIKQLHASFDTIACKMKNIDYANGKMLDEITHIRIFKRDKNIRYVNSIHEMLINKTKNKNLKAFLADEKDLLIYHTGYSLTNRGEKSERNLKLLLLEIDKGPEKPAIYQYISDCYFGIEDWKQAIKYAQMFIDSGAKFIGYNVKPHQNIIDSMLHLKYNTDEILKEINIGLKKFPRNPSFHFYLANMLYDLKKYDEAYAEYKITLKLQEEYDDIEINSIPPNIYYIYYYMGIIALYQNDDEKALTYFIESLRLEKMNDNCLFRLLLIIKDFPTQDVILLLNSLYDSNQEKELDFLVSNLTKINISIVLAYYTNMRLKKFKQDDITVVYMLLSNGQYEKTFEIMRKCLITAPEDRLFGLLTMTSAIMSENNNYLLWIIKYMNGAIRDFANIMLCNELTVFPENYKQDYYDLVTRLLILGNNKALQKVINLSQCFNEEDIYVGLGNIFLRQQLYAEAVQFYIQFLDRVKEDDQRVVNIVFAIGLCWYKLRDYENASNVFIQAYELGYNQNDIYEFLRWSMDKVSNGMKRKIEDIIATISK
ncbi:glycosyltransferase family 2 protein [Desulfitobacterium sp.]|uniref:glycosyltransferase family 2 protein n=1 Tax=Desulfitobacterium sp. TaxID=49981 RepID=UPI002B2034E8|nr:glycosyltransferase [Desulfitobacterium sp.]MEA4902168.1 glycosyltransferase [Desulfitobacterium sp.]